MSMKFGSSEVKAVADVLDGDYSTAEEAARAALSAMEDIFAKRAKFVVVGQLSDTPDRREIPPSDPEAIKVSLGWYSTEGDARSASESLWHSASSGDTYRTWVLPVFHGTPAELHRKQKERYEAAEAKRKEDQRKRFHESIRKHQEAMEIRAKGGRGSCVNCGHEPWEHGRDGSGRGECKLASCGCPKWKEKLK